MDGAEVTQLAARWQSEFADDADWHLRRKIEQLETWGDREGAKALGRVLDWIHAEQALVSLEASPRVA